MAGQNRFLLSETQRRADTARSSCVFISYRRSDEVIAKEMAAFLAANGIDFWLDLRSLDVGRARALGDDLALADAIEKGLDGCTHLLGILSATTFDSAWVPYEIGSARGRERPVAHVIERSVQDFQIPAFVRLGTPIADQAALRSWIRSVSSVLLDSRQASTTPAGVQAILPSVRSLRL